jgi:hypothetical protein
MTCRVKDFARNSVVEFSRSGQEKTKLRPGPGRKTGTLEMKFTGTMIEDLIATVEHAEQRTQVNRVWPAESSLVETSRVDRSFVGPSFVETSLVESSLVEPWFASVRKNAAYESKFVGVA